MVRSGSATAVASQLARSGLSLLHDPRPRAAAAVSTSRGGRRGAPQWPPDARAAAGHRRGISQSVAARTGRAGRSPHTGGRCGRRAARRLGARPCPRCRCRLPWVPAVLLLLAPPPHLHPPSRGRLAWSLERSRPPLPPRRRCPLSALPPSAAASVGGETAGGCQPLRLLLLVIATWGVACRALPARRFKKQYPPTRLASRPSASVCCGSAARDRPLSHQGRPTDRGIMMVASLRRTLWIPTANQECGRSVWQRPVVGQVCTLDKAGFLSLPLSSTIRK